ncbi:hypothetical protein BVRB_1g014450 [Beta vulgaris subsp. vulgaris]|uniref:uncharacterized protein LOC104901112 n=1 Tax=Beta vulgaris subsp. vulgaris TaxID=3555 RepID=UPI00053FEF4F|nr:uncharacterized protein LOC104901112 [Beta vulgaris subsp. vulgaris]KMT19263.1 hypothetical protein BVRB_1g014450 [Beta vulgaris subsp. vulgaris]
MAGQNQGGNLDQFESFFKRADLDQDGRISGAEAVAFFQGSGLNKQVLAQIWMHADEKRAGFLGRQEFYNALKLVTVAQSKRELTPEIVKSALYGPASSRIPPPQINLPPAPTSQPSSVSSSPAMQMGAVTPTASQNLGYRGPVPPNQNMQQQYFPSPGNQSMRPSQALPASSASLPYQSGPGLPNLGVSPTGLPSSGFSIPSRPSLGMSTHGFPGSGMSSPGLPSSGMSTPGVPNSGMSPTAVPGSGMSATGLPNSGVSNNWMGGNMSGAPYGHMSQIPNKGTIPSTPQNTIVVSQAANNNFKATNTSVDGFSSNSVAGSDPFSAFSMTKSGASPATSSVATLPTSSAIVPVSASSPASSVPTSSAIVPVTVSQPPLRSSSLDSLQSAFVKQPLGGQTQQPHGFSNLSQSVPQVSSSGVSPGPGDSTLEQSQPSWPKMTTPGIQKYTKVFMEVDTDRDGKITGEQARNLFLSWRLPREVLKQVWDLADQDNDSMLSLREFCIALYLMERYREGRSLPTSLPNSIMFDETLMRMTGIPNSSHGNAGWGATSGTGYRPVHGIPGSQPVAPTAGPRPVMQSAPQPNAKIQFQQPKSKTSVLDNSQAFQLTDGEQNVLQSSPPGIIDAENKVGKVEKVILDSREKLEFYRTKMQELVLYKSRCDNRLNEIIERASADKREADLLGKKYEEKYKQVAEIASKLTIEEAKFREYQERKTELQQAILNMEQGGSVDGILQVRADRIQSDFEELLKALSERCKKHGIEIKSAALMELPKGWQPGIQEGASVWDEEWDKFDDEGLLFDKEVGTNAQNGKPSLFENGTYSHDDVLSPDSSSNVDAKSELQSSKGERALDSESGYAYSEDDSARSPHGSPAHRATLESPSQDFSDIFARSEADTDFHRSFDDQGWGNFDGTDDADSVWGFNSKDQHGDRMFESSGFGLSPRTDSPQGDSSYDKRSPFNFADSVPGTPSFSKSGNSPRYSEAGDGFFDNYSRFDSFSVNESNRFSPPHETLTRFDSISSSRSGFGGHNRGFTSFDDADPFGSSGPFKVSSETPKKSSDNWSSF